MIPKNLSNSVYMYGINKSFYCNSPDINYIGVWFAVKQEVQTDVCIKLNKIHLHHFP